MFKERVALGEIKLIRDDKAMPLTMDGSASPMRLEDGSLRYFFTDLGGKPFYRAYKGTVEDPFKEFEFEFKWDFNDYPDTWPCGIWAQSIYRCDDGMLIGFCHREDLNREDHTYMTNYHIGLGVSFDDGRNFFYAGDICGTGANYIPEYHANMGGCPTVVKDGYFYTYFNEYYTIGKRGISAARFSVDETIAALKKKKLPKVFKYSGDGKWDTPGIGGIGAPIFHKSPFGTTDFTLALDTHSKASFCEALGCYIMTFQTGSCGELMMYFSVDCEHWDEYMSVATVTGDDRADFMQPYSTFVDLGAGRPDSFTLGGNKFMLHFLKKGIKNYAYDEYYVREITIND